MIRALCVYCSSSNAVDSVFKDAASELGEKIAANKYELVYGGGNIGLMGIVAGAVKHNGGRITGVIPARMEAKGLAYREADELIFTKDMRERKEIMQLRSDAFICLPGGFGTMEEIFEIIVMKQLHLIDCPIVFLNVDDYYASLARLFDTMYSRRFVKEEYRSLYYFASTVDDALHHIKNYKPVSGPEKWFDS